MTTKNLQEEILDEWASTKTSFDSWEAWTDVAYRPENIMLPDVAEIAIAKTQERTKAEEIKRLTEIHQNQMQTALDWMKENTKAELLKEIEERILKLMRTLEKLEDYMESDADEINAKIEELQDLYDDLKQNKIGADGTPKVSKPLFKSKSPTKIKCVKCECCGLEVEKMPKFKKGECPEADQHYFFKTKKEGEE